MSNCIPCTILGPGWILIGDSTVNSEDIEVTIHGDHGHTCQLQHAESPTAVDWLDLGPAVAGANVPIVLTHPGGASLGERYDRVTVQP